MTGRTLFGGRKGRASPAAEEPIATIKPVPLRGTVKVYWGLIGTPHLPSSVGHPLPSERAGILISLPLPWGDGGPQGGG